MLRCWCAFSSEYLAVSFASSSVCASTFASFSSASPKMDDTKQGLHVDWKRNWQSLRAAEEEGGGAFPKSVSKRRVLVFDHIAEGPRAPPLKPREQETDTDTPAAASFHVPETSLSLLSPSLPSLSFSLSVNRCFTWSGSKARAPDRTICSFAPALMGDRAPGCRFVREAVERD